MSRGFFSRSEVVVEAESGERAGSEIFEQHVGAGGQLERERAAARVLEVDRHRLLVAIDREKVGRLAAHEGRAEGAGVVAALGTLELDHARAEVGELHRAERSGQHAREIEHHQVVERQHANRLCTNGAQKIASLVKRAFNRVAKESPMAASMTERCVVCARSFTPQFAFQVAVLERRAALLLPPRLPQGGARRRGVCRTEAGATAGDLESKGRHRKDHHRDQPRCRDRRSRLRRAAGRSRRAGKRRRVARDSRRAHALSPAHPDPRRRPRR